VLLTEDLETEASSAQVRGLGKWIDGVDNEQNNVLL
jgi:hypothetical protein